MMNCNYYNIPNCPNCKINGGLNKLKVECYVKIHYRVILTFETKEELINDYIFITKNNHQIPQFICVINNYFPQYSNLIRKLSILI